MRALTVTAVVAICAVLAACSVEPSSRAPLTAKAWDTSFLRVQHVFRPDENAVGGPKSPRHPDMSMASYAQIPVSMGSVFATEMQGMAETEQGTAGLLPDADTVAVIAVGAEAASAPPVEPPASAPPARPAVVTAARAVTPPSAPAAVTAEAWYDSRVVDPALRPITGDRDEHLPMAGADLANRLGAVDLAPRGGTDLR